MTSIHSITGYNFKNHAQLSLSLEGNSCVTGLNGSGKTNILEAVYLGINGIFPPDRTIDSCITHGKESGFVRIGYLDANGIPFETVVSLDSKKKRLGYSLQGTTTTRSAFLKKHGMRAVLLSPMDMNLVYLSPSLRRNFIDEILLLSYSDFSTIRKKYASVLKSRNALLKKLQTTGGDTAELAIWDTLFTEITLQYQSHRDALLAHLQDALNHKNELIRKSIVVTLRFSSELANIDVNGRSQYLQEYLERNRARDILVGHTCVGPHLDDLELLINTDGKTYFSSELLSRGENKTMLLLMKEAGARFIETVSGAKTFFLLDDLESELDEDHFMRIIQSLHPRSFLLSGIEFPNKLLETDVKEIMVPKDGFGNIH